MAETILKLTRNFLKIDGDRDFFSDQIHHKITFTILIISAVASTTLQFYADPIQCIQPAQFTEGYTSFARTLCWLNNTYFYPQTYTRLPLDKSQRSQQTLHYYQWLPFIYLIQSFFFLFPYLIWISFYQKNGLNPRSLILQGLKFSKKPEITRSVAKEIERYLMCRQLARCKRKLMFRQNLINNESSSSSPLILPNVSILVRSHGSYLVLLYLFVKFLYIVNIISQLFSLNSIVSTGNYGFLRFGYDTFKYLVKTSFKDRLSTLSHQHQQLFPFVTLCDFHIRELGQDHFYTIECILLINIFYEKIYFALWLWYIVLVLFSILTFIYSTFLLIPLFSRRRFLSKLIDFIQSKRNQTFSSPINSLIEQQSTTNSNEIIEEFFQDQTQRERFIKWLQPDGVFLFHLLNQHVGQRFLVKTLQDLIQIWIENYKEKSKLAEKLLKNQFEF